MDSRDWQFRRGIRELEDLQRLYGHRPKAQKPGELPVFFPGGKLEPSQTERKMGGKYYYITGKLRGSVQYVNDSLRAARSGTIRQVQHYQVLYYCKGRPGNVCRTYYDYASSTSSRSCSRIMYENVYDPLGEVAEDIPGRRAHREVIHDWSAS